MLFRDFINPYINRSLNLEDLGLRQLIKQFEQWFMIKFPI